MQNISPRWPIVFRGGITFSSDYMSQFLVWKTPLLLKGREWVGWGIRRDTEMSSAASSFLKAPLCSIEGGHLPWSVGTTMTTITSVGKGWGYGASLPWGSALIFWEFFKAAWSQVNVWHWPWFPDPRDVHKVESTSCYNHGTGPPGGCTLAQMPAGSGEEWPSWSHEGW